jgi:dephospho-CoA kinase
MVYCVGLTGNIASGKSTVAGLFAQRRIDVISADQISRQLTQQGKPAYQAILAYFGKEILLPQGELNRALLRERITTDPAARQWLEQLLHPLIRAGILSAVDACHSPYCIIEIPLLTDKRHYPYLQRILLVTASEAVQIERVMQRDHCSRAQAQAMLALQPNNALRLTLYDDQIINDAGLDALEDAVELLHKQYLCLSGR